MIMVELIKRPSDMDWLWVKRCAINTMGYTEIKNEPDQAWKHKMLMAEHSPIRELWFGFRLTIPYWVSVHLVRHHVGCNHYVQTQRDDRTLTDVSREEKPQGEMVSHILSINAQELIQLSHKRLCNLASKETREVVKMMCDVVIKNYPEFEGVLVPNCVYRGGRCTEISPCNDNKRL